MSKPRILVVDDDLPILTLMRNLLREFGFEAVVAGTGAQALAAASEQAPDLVLLDINMPEMSGSEVIRALRRDHAEQLPILILSGAVQKPFDVPELMQQIRDCLSVSR